MTMISSQDIGMEFWIERCNEGSETKRKTEFCPNLFNGETISKCYDDSVRFVVPFKQHELK